MEKLFNKLDKCDKALIITKDCNKEEVIKKLFERYQFHNYKVQTKSEIIKVLKAPNEILLKQQLINKFSHYSISEIDYLLTNYYLLENYNLKRYHDLFEYLNQLDFSLNVKLPTGNIILFDLVEDDFRKYLYSNRNCIVIEREKNIENIELTITQLPDIYQEVSYVGNSISDYLSNGGLVENVKIVVGSSEYDYYFRTIFPFYSLPYKSDNQKLIIQIPAVAEFIEKLQKKFNVEEAANDLQSLVSVDVYEQVIKIINKYVDFFNNFDDFFDLFYDEIQKKRVKVPELGFIKINQIEEISNFCNYQIYVLGFSKENFSKISQSHSVFSDVEKKELGLNRSFDRIILERKKLFDFLSYNCENIILSYSNKVKKNLHTAFGKIDQIKFSVNEHYFIQTNYSEKLTNFLILSHKELLSNQDYIKHQNNILEKKKISKYNNEFSLSGLKIEKIPRLSSTSLETYANCGFRFYLKNILRVKKSNNFRDNSFSLLGLYAHSVLEQSLKDKSMSISKIFVQVKAMDKYKNEFKLERDKIYLEKYNDLLTDLITKLRIEDDDYQIIGLEEDILYKDHKSNLEYEGVIDKVMQKVIDSHQHLKIHDYKTGLMSLDLEHLKYGLGIQTLYYSWLYKKRYELEEIIIDEIAIHSVNLEKGKIKKTNQYSGFTIIDYPKKEKGNNDKRKKIEPDVIAKNLDEIDQVIQELTSEIINNNFVINPKTTNKGINGIDSCKHCDYLDICYRKRSDYHVIEEVKNGEK